MGPRLHELLKTSFDFRWNVSSARSVHLFCKEVNDSSHFDLELFDLTAASVSRCPLYDGTLPFDGHLSVNMKSSATVRSGFYFAGAAVRTRRHKPLPPLESRPSCTEGGLSYVNWLFGSKATRCAPTAEDVKDLAQLKSLWTSVKDMQSFALDEMGILMDQRQWSSWISKELECKRTAMSLNEKGYIEYFKGVASSVTGPDASLPKPVSTSSTLGEGDITTGLVLGPRKKTTLVSLVAQSPNPNTTTTINPNIDPDPPTNLDDDLDPTTINPITVYRTVYSRKRRSCDTFRTRNNVFQRRRRILRNFKFRNMSEDVVNRIASIENRQDRNRAKNDWLHSQM